MLWPNQTRNQTFWSCTPSACSDTKGDFIQGSAGGSVMLWGCFAADGSGVLVKTDDIMNSAKYQEISA